LQRTLAFDALAESKDRGKSKTKRHDRKADDLMWVERASARQNLS
jgi:hypothetical protein